MNCAGFIIDASFVVDTSFVVDAGFVIVDFMSSLLFLLLLLYLLFVCVLSSLFYFCIIDDFYLLQHNPKLVKIRRSLGDMPTKTWHERKKNCQKNCQKILRFESCDSFLFQKLVDYTYILISLDIACFV